MFRGAPDRAGLWSSWPNGKELSIRTRTPGDRILPFGSNRTKRLKDLFIDQRIPRAQRDRIPLLCDHDQIVWIPGVTLDHRYRLPATSKRPGQPRHGSVWIAELSPPSPARHT